MTSRMLVSRVAALLVTMLVVAACDTDSMDGSGSSQNQPRISISPATGYTETEITVRGSHYPTEALVNIYVGEANARVIPEPLTSITTDANGKFRVRITIPGQWPDGDPVLEPSLVIAAISQDYEATSFATFQIEPGNQVSSPSIRISPNEGEPGTVIEISGQDFAPETSIALRLGTPQSGLNEADMITVLTEENGSFKVELVLPTLWPGSDAPIIEETLLIAAVDETIGQTLATDAFHNLAAVISATSEPTEAAP